MFVVQLAGRVNGLLQRRGYGAKSELARVLGISPSRLGHYLTGRLKWPLEFLLPTAEFLGVAPHDLLDARPSPEAGYLPAMGLVAGVARLDLAKAVRVPEFIATPGRFGGYVQDAGSGFPEIPERCRIGDALAFQEGNHVPGPRAIVAAIAGEDEPLWIAQVQEDHGREVSLLRGGSIDRPTLTVQRDALLGYAVAIVRYRGDEITKCEYEGAGIVPGKFYYWDGIASLS